MGPAFLQREAGSLRLWMRGEIDGGGASQRSERFLQARARTELRASRTLLAACVPALMRGDAATPLIAGDRGRRPLVCRAAVYPGRRNLVGAEPRRLLMFTKRRTCDSGVRRRTRSASTRGGPVTRGARGLRMGYAMMGEGRRAADCARRGTGPCAGCGPASLPDRESRLNNYYPPTCVRLVDSPSNACPQPAPACIVLPRAAPQWGGRANPENRILRKTQEVRQTI